MTIHDNPLVIINRARIRPDIVVSASGLGLSCEEYNCRRQADPIPYP